MRNGSSSELRNVYVQTFTEYGDGINEDESLQLGLAQLQYKDPATGRWTDGYQDYYQDGPTLFRFSGTFIGSIPRLARGEQAVMELRVRIDREAPAGAAFALSSAVYAGRNNSCHTNGDTYDFRVLAVGSDPGRGDDAEPNGEKPAGPHDAPGKGTDPQGGAVGALPVGGSLASTGSSSVLPVLGLIGGVAVVAGTGAVLAVRRRRHETV